ncbi:hypothetical protein [Clostridium sp. E02]|uniref:hypothetical protein n=1 Tax=Clostridium sp. E02 TaxID=2487134 RepID=UPI000F5457B5|nr:hypothetical protein [Clostridium sp. E02]
MRKTIQQINLETGIKIGVIEEFRRKLQILNIISNNESLNEEHVDLLKKIANEKSENDTWEKVMYKNLYENYWNILHTQFEWQTKTVMEDLIWNIKNENYNVDDLMYQEGSIALKDKKFHVYCSIIDNFAAQGKVYEPYENSMGSDGNTIMYEVKHNKEKYIYYVIGKLNHYTGNEDMHIFYNDDDEFNIMKCRYVCGGPSDEGIYKELFETIHNAYNKLKGNE